MATKTSSHSVNKSRADKIRRLIPTDQDRLPDGRPTHEVLQEGIAAWANERIMIPLREDVHHPPGGSMYLWRGSKYGRVEADAYYQRSPERSAPLHAMTWHAASRVWLDGFKDGIAGGEGRCAYWGALCLHDDLVAVALAALDLDLTGDSSVADWYLASDCYSPWCSTHRGDHRPGEQPICGSGTCGTAMPYTTCDCSCGGVHHGMGRGAGRPQRGRPLDWSTMPPLRFHAAKEMA